MCSGAGTLLVRAASGSGARVLTASLAARASALASRFSSRLRALASRRSSAVLGAEATTFMPLLRTPDALSAQPMQYGGLSGPKAKTRQRPQNGRSHVRPRIPGNTFDFQLTRYASE